MWRSVSRRTSPRRDISRYTSITWMEASSSASTSSTLDSRFLLAILLRMGVHGESVVNLAMRILVECGGLSGLAKASFSELEHIHGIGPVKVTQIKAALELGRRLLIESPQDRPQIRSPADAANLVMMEMSLLEQEHLRLL